jgi:hypothetical protein
MHDKIIRIKMLCDWCSSKDLCNGWKIMCENNYKWKNIEMTWEDENIDYYVIFNSPNRNDFYIKEKTIIFQMEPKSISNKWGVWANPNPKDFLFVGTHEKCLNTVELHFKKIPKEINDKNRYNKPLIILSGKKDEPGHIKRINLVKNINLIDVYGKKNYHEVLNYKGELPNNNKEDLFIKYKYSFNTENNSEYNYATEKIWEPIICENLCFYWGCPNLEEYIHPLSFVRLDLDNIDESIKIIEKAIKEDWWSQRIEFIREAKNKILNELIFFNKINKIINFSK